MSEHALERARERARSRRRKPRGPRPRWTWWTNGSCALAGLVQYVHDGMDHKAIWAGYIGLITLANVGLAHWALRWWLWERQERLPHVKPDRFDWTLVVLATASITVNVLWLAGAR